ncbi:MAG: ATP synthase F1 subunit epsilon [Ruminococcaceae bacterium]|nr:ATP synthase F1 subunit epsilon [Oscillospiraceae bacterium]MBQ3215987.1 ATP synthase F1 subunit epsilon [Oscillospiraceae bacterium]
MTPFSLKIVTPDGIKYDGQAEELIVRTTTGDVGILAGHLGMVAPLGMGRATVIIDGQKRYAACIGGMVAVVNGRVDLVPTSFEWAQDIDIDRTERSYQRAQQTLNDKNASDTDIRLAKARLHRALVRRNVASSK